MKKSIFSLLFLIGCATMSSAQEITFTEVSHYFDHTKGNRKEYKAVEPRDDYELVLERVRQQVYASQPVEKMDQGATSLMKMLTPEGTWPQIDYKCFFRTNWEPVTHLNYVRQLATAYTTPRVRSTATSCSSAPSTRPCAPGTSTSPAPTTGGTTTSQPPKSWPTSWPCWLWACRRGIKAVKG